MEDLDSFKDFDFFEELKQGLEEAVAFKKGDCSRCRVSVAEVPIPEYQAGDVAHIRSILDLSQRGLAAALGVSVRTVEAWEAGKNPPSGPASHLLYLLEQEPDLVKRLLIFKDSSSQKKGSVSGYSEERNVVYLENYRISSARANNYSHDTVDRMEG